MCVDMHNKHAHNHTHSTAKLHEHIPYRIAVPDSSISSCYNDNNVNYTDNSSV